MYSKCTKFNSKATKVYSKGTKVNSKASKVYSKGTKVNSKATKVDFKVNTTFVDIEVTSFFFIYISN